MSKVKKTTKLHFANSGNRKLGFNPESDYYKRLDPKTKTSLAKKGQKMAGQNKKTELALEKLRIKAAEKEKKRQHKLDQRRIDLELEKSRRTTRTISTVGNQAIKAGGTVGANALLFNGANQLETPGTSDDETKGTGNITFDPQRDIR